MSDREIEARYLAAIGLAREAGAIAMRYFSDRDSLGISMKGAQDWLTAADGAVEAHLRARIAAAFPGDKVLGEEMGAGDAGAMAELVAARHLWVIDPIDGTANFARAHPHWCISIGLLRDGRPEVGIIFAPAMEITWAARRGAGATRNGAPIAVSGIDDMRRASIEIGWSPRRGIDDYLAFLRAVMLEGAAPKRCGSGALGLAFVADGRTEGYLEAHINSWDVAAGIVIVTEAGGRVNDFFSGDGLTEGGAILAAPPALAGTLARLSGIAL